METVPPAGGRAPVSSMSPASAGRRHVRHTGAAESPLPFLRRSHGSKNRARAAPRSTAPPHPASAAEPGPLEGRARRRGAGDAAAAVPQDHLSVGPDIQQQRELLSLVESGRQKTGRSVRPTNPARSGRATTFPAGWTGSPSSPAECTGRPDRRGIRRLPQRGRGEAQGQVAHAGVPRQHGEDHLLRLPAHPAGHLPQDLLQSGQHRPLKGLHPLPGRRRRCGRSHPRQRRSGDCGHSPRPASPRSSPPAALRPAWWSRCQRRPAGAAAPAR